MASPLQSFAQGSSRYLNINDLGGRIEGIYLGCELEPDKFNPGLQRVAYNIEINNDKKILGSSSKRLAKAMLNAHSEDKIGQFIKITRTGEGFDTQYEVDFSEIPF